MKKIYSLLLAAAFAGLSANATPVNDIAIDNEEMVPEVQLTAHTSVPIKAMVNSYVSYGGDDYTTTDIIEPIRTHLDARFPGKTVQGVTREGHTYVVDLGQGQHIRYDNCGNPVCYGTHGDDCNHCHH